MSDKELKSQAKSIMLEIENEECLHNWGDKPGVIASFVLFLRAISILPSLYETVYDFVELQIEAIKPHLIKRLKIQHEIQMHPKILQIPIKAPLFIIGAARTGTQFLHHLINEDPLTRSPLLYEMVTPTKDDVLPHSDDAWHAARIAAAQRFLDDCAAKCSDEYLAIHPMDPLEPEECTQIMGSDFMLMEPLTLLPEYKREYFGQSPERLVTTMKFHKQVMQLLTYNRPSAHRHWTFKSPFHGNLIPAIRAVYPDAQFIMPHRNLSDVLPSLLGLQSRLSTWYFSDTEVQKNWMEHRTKDVFDDLVAGLNKIGTQISEMQKEDNPPTIVHCQFKDLTADPIAEVERIYHKLGREFTNEFKEKLQAKIHSMNLKRGPSIPYEAVALSKEYIDKMAKSYYEMFGIKD